MVGGWGAGGGSRPSRRRRLRRRWGRCRGPSSPTRAFTSSSARPKSRGGPAGPGPSGLNRAGPELDCRAHPRRSCAARARSVRRRGKCMRPKLVSARVGADAGWWGGNVGAVVPAQRLPAGRRSRLGPTGDSRVWWARRAESVTAVLFGPSRPEQKKRDSGTRRPRRGPRRCAHACSFYESFTARAGSAVFGPVSLGPPPRQRSRNAATFCGSGFSEVRMGSISSCPVGWVWTNLP